MHRTQILLENWQHQALKARAEQEGRSLSDLVRGIVSEALAKPRRSGSGLDEVKGIGEDAAACGRDHDRFLYGDHDAD